MHSGGKVIEETGIEGCRLTSEVKMPQSCLLLCKCVEKDGEFLISFPPPPLLSTSCGCQGVACDLLTRYHVSGCVSVCV